jgi:hypothetical protein
MMRMLLSLLSLPILVALTAPAAAAADPAGLTLPPEVRIAVGKLARITVETDAKIIAWRTPAGVDASVCTGRELTCTAPSGRYTIVCAAVVADTIKFAECTLIVDGTAPVPLPVDLLAGELARLYAAESAADKLASLAKLQALWRKAATLPGDPSLQTAEALLAVMKLAADDLLPAGLLQPMRQRIREELNKSLPTDPAAVLTPESRESMRVLFARVSAALDLIK